ncbi:MAG: hypothetical protein KatS3mg096_725 [Candidatus Parcubacteria bacterium]|nr:MAG: hypothetical protein KatS3mg096_725 [Candidatus Parcubacteria bacterium]
MSWKDYKDWLETKNPSMFRVVWEWLWRAIVLYVAIAFVIVFIVAFIRELLAPQEPVKYLPQEERFEFRLQ